MSEGPANLWEGISFLSSAENLKFTAVGPSFFSPWGFCSLDSLVLPLADIFEAPMVLRVVELPPPLLAYAFHSS